jgi:hypothetical protein
VEVATDEVSLSRLHTLVCLIVASEELSRLGHHICWRPIIDDVLRLEHGMSSICSDMWI